MDSLLTYRRHMFHWRQTGATCFVTWRLHPHRPSLAETEREAVVGALLRFDGQRHVLDAYVVMDAHVHAILTVASGFELQALVPSWKSFTAHRLQREHGRGGAIWQRDYFDRIISSETRLS